MLSNKLAATASPSRTTERSVVYEDLTWYAKLKAPHLRSLTPIVLVLRGTIVSRAHGTHKKLYVSLFPPTIFGPIVVYGLP